MSVQAADNFSIYGTSTANLLAAGLWVALSGASLTNDPDGVSGGKALHVPQNDVGVSCRLAVPTPGDNMKTEVRCWFTQLPNSSGHSQEIQYRNAANDSKYSLRTSPSGTLSVIRRTDGTVLGTTSGPVIGAGAWHHIGFSMNRTTGDYEVRVEGVSVLSGTDPAPVSGNIDIINFDGSWSDGSGASNTSWYLKDLVISDDAGTVNNDFVGPVSVITLLPDSDVSNGWALSSGVTVYSLIDETTPDDTDYIQADATPPAPAIVGLTNLPSDVVAVRALIPIVRSLKTDGGDAKLQLSLLSSGDSDDGVEHAIAVSAAYYWDVSELDPHTGVAWTPVGVSAATLKLNRTL